MTSNLTPKGPAADPKFPPSDSPSNPYNFSPQLLHAGSLPPKITDSHVFFFGYEGTDPHVCLQQWYPAPFTAHRNPYSIPPDKTPVEFPTAEHYMMYHKALLMGDQEVADRISREAHPSAVKKLGRQVKDFDAKLWNKNADRIVEEANWLKFNADEALKEVLVGTGDRVLVEASPDDKIWGIGFNSEDAEGKEAEWGENGLGKALMKVRDRIKKKQAV